jgi:hypothetical protein
VVRSGGNSRQANIEGVAVRTCQGELFGASQLVDEAAIVGQQCEAAVASLNAEHILEAPAEEPEYRLEEKIPPPPEMAEEDEDKEAIIGGKPPTDPSFTDPPGLNQASGVVPVDLDDEEVDLEERDLETARTLAPDAKIYDDDLTAILQEPNSARALEKITSLEDPADEFVEKTRIREATPDNAEIGNPFELHAMDELCSASLNSDYGSERLATSWLAAQTLQGDEAV